MQCNAGIEIFSILAFQYAFTLALGRNAIQAKYCEPGFINTYIIAI